MAHRPLALAAVLLLLCGTAAADDLDVLSKGDVPSDRLVSNYLLGLAEKAFDRRDDEYEKLVEPEKLAARQQRLRQFFQAQLGGFPERTPLNARVVGRLDRGDYVVEKVIYESRPKFFVAALLYLPKKEGKVPGVLVPCGHSAHGKAYEPYQRGPILLAKNGIAALCYDPIGQGERGQLLDENGKQKYDSTLEHTLVGVGAILTGHSAAQIRIWDGMRSLDYLESRPEVDPDRLGCTGNSGGGTLTSYLMALDERIKVAAPSCYITSMRRMLETIGAQDAEQNIFGQVAFGMGHLEYITMRSPRPTLILCATRDFFDIAGTWDVYRRAKRWYEKRGHPERVDLVETDAKHGYWKPLREGMARWMKRWLDNEDKPIFEPDFPILDEKEAQCTPEGQVLRAPGARSAFDVNSRIEDRLLPGRKALWKSAPRGELLERVRGLIGARKLADLPKPKVEKVGTIAREGCAIEKLVVQVKEEVPLPVLAFVPREKSTGAVLYCHGEGKRVDAAAGGRIEDIALQYRTVWAVDLLGIGETESKENYKGWKKLFGPDWQDHFMAYLLGKSFVGIRTENVLTCARALRERTGNETVTVIGIGEAAVPVLHAAALEPDLFGLVKLHNMVPSWSDVVKNPESPNQLVNAVHGALRVYDLPDLVFSLGSKVDQSSDPWR